MTILVEKFKDLGRLINELEDPMDRFATIALLTVAFVISFILLGLLALVFIVMPCWISIPLLAIGSIPTIAYFYMKGKKNND